MAVTPPRGLRSFTASTVLLGCLCFAAAAHAVTRARIVVPDVLCLPDEEIFVRASLIRTGLLGLVRPGLPGEVLEFIGDDGRPIAACLTDVSGSARISYRPERPGIVRLKVRLAPTPRVQAEPETARIFAREKKRPLFLTTVEDGLRRREAAEGLLSVRAEPAPPSAGAQDILTAAAACSTIVYLTAGPENRRDETRAWLTRHGFPEAPLLAVDSDPDPEDPEASAWRTDLFASFRDVSPGSSVLATGNPSLASQAARENLRVYLLDGQPPPAESNGKNRDEADGIRKVEGWKAIPAPCERP